MHLPVGLLWKTIWIQPLCQNPVLISQRILPIKSSRIVDCASILEFLGDHRRKLQISCFPKFCFKCSQVLWCPLVRFLPPKRQRDIIRHSKGSCYLFLRIQVNPVAQILASLLQSGCYFLFVVLVVLGFLVHFRSCCLANLRCLRCGSHPSAGNVIHISLIFWFPEHIPVTITCCRKRSDWVVLIKFTSSVGIDHRRHLQANIHQETT